MWDAQNRRTRRPKTNRASLVVRSKIKILVVLNSNECGGRWKKVDRYKTKYKNTVEHCGRFCKAHEDQHRQKTRGNLQYLRYLWKSKVIGHQGQIW